ncbi:MAG: TIR domain-containing protein [Opitutus sp.]|nr:TIR domain-containing protein [Opitutus sp.]
MSVERSALKVERSAPRGAVFLSYASQDAEAAKRICEALRAKGVEVWFDVEGGLETGDEWDQKIRRQIKECVLFIAVISRNTQARHEGYFRIEWDLAAERARGIASGVAFILPVVIDDTREPDALVPDRFRAVQWTRLPGGVMAPEVLARFVKLWSHRAGVVKQGDVEAGRPRPAQRDEGVASPASVPAEARRRVPAVAWGAAVLVAVLGVGGYYWVKRPAEFGPNAGAGTPPVVASIWPHDPDLRRAFNLADGTEANSEDFALAEEIAKKALAKNSTDPEAVTVMARVQVSYLFRGFDRSDERRATARHYAERAVQLAPHEPEALAALGVFHMQRGGSTELARELLNKAIALRPDEPYYYRHRDTALFLDPRVPAAEAIASGEQTAARFPRDALVQYELARHYRDLGRIDECERAFDRTLAIRPIANAIAWKARLALNVRGDFAETKALLDRVPPRMRSVERVVISRWIYAMAGTDREDGMETLQSLTNPWIEDFYYAGPKSLLLAALLEASGKRESARLHYEAALTETRNRQAREPTNLSLRNVETCALLGLGRLDEARAANRAVMESVRRPYRYDPFDVWWFSEIPRCLLLGERETALQILREAAGGEAGTPSGRIPTGDTRVTGRAAVRMAMRQDARMAPFRDDPEIVALLAEPKKETAALPASEAAKLTARAVALYSKLNYTREDLATAEEVTRKATELEPDSAAAWGARAGVQATFLYRNWNFSERRRQDTQAFAGRALGLNPEEPEALLALGHLLRHQGVTEQAIVHFRRALAAEPANLRAARALGTTLSFDGRREAGRAVLIEALKREPREPLLRYDLALTFDVYISQSGQPLTEIKTALEHLNAGLAVQPLASLLTAKAVALAGWEGDLPAMRAALAQLEKLPLAERVEDRAVFIAMWGALLERDPARVAAAAALTAKNYFEDTVVPRRPKDWLLALAHRVEKKENLARLDWQRAESLLRQRLRDDPNNQARVVELATTLAWLGRTDEALLAIAPAEAAAREEPTRQRSRPLADFYAALGDAAKAAPYLKQALNQTVFLTSKTLPLDPWFDKLRGQPAFEALLAEAKK